MTKKIRLFISHAASDRSLADAVFDLLHSTFELPHSEVFCSSLEGMDIPSGLDFMSYIKDQIQEPEAVLLLLTPNYLASQFCLAELGAAWAMTHRVFPLLVPPLTYGDVRGVLAVTQIDRIESDLTKFVYALAEHLAKPINGVRWEVKKEQFLARLPSILDSLPQPSTISATQHQALQAKCDQAISALQDSEREISSLMVKNQQLVACKDALEVAAVERQHLSGLQLVEEGFANLKAAFDRLPPVVPYLMFRDRIGMDTSFNTPDDRQAAMEAAKAVEEGYLEHTGAEYSLNDGDPLVKKASKQLLGVDRLLASEAITEDVCESFEDDNGFQLSLKNRRLWERHLCGLLRRFG